MAEADAPHLPQQVPIDLYGNGGFRFGGMSHRGSILSIPDGIWAWPIFDAKSITAASLAPIIDRIGSLDFVFIGGGLDPWVLPERIRAPFREHCVSFDTMTTGAAVRTYNILLAEGRRIAAALIALD